MEFEMNYATPESCGISSADIEEYIRALEAKKLVTHDIIITKGDNLVFETYWKPFDEKFLHRMYSVTKSIVAIAVGFAEQDGLLSLDDTMEMHFPEEIKDQPDENMRKQTVRDMLTMTTAKLAGNWFRARHPDRVQYYFQNNGVSRPSGTVFQYDSSGSFVLCALVERLTGKTFMEYMQEKLFDKLGISRDAYCLKCPGGHSWGDSALVMTPRDMMRIARFMMLGGRWNGEQILNEKFVTDATSKLVDTDMDGFDDYAGLGYGYYIWRTYDNGFFFNGMGCQLYICLPDQDIIFGYNGDNQGNPGAKQIIVDKFFELIARRAKKDAIPENPEALASLEAYAKTLELYKVTGEASSPIEEKISGRTFKLNENPMGITEIKFTFENGICRMDYVNATGAKTLNIGMGKNEFGLFPEEGYSKEVGSEYAPGNFYKCAASGAWVMPNKLFVRVQIVDEYFGILNMYFGFKDENTLGIHMNKTAEDFLATYTGYADGRAK